ncbi:MAG TPA: hypothetical protein VJN69_02130 [Candidatus Acidoferrales bacterium]|nr:hypothetical protein [Candidatus Acidoferrales bacterium]
MNTTDATGCKTVYWHRELPPMNVEAIGEHIVEATSEHVANTMLHRDELWNRCYENLMANARVRIEQEIAQKGGSCAHVLHESVDSRSNDMTQEAWLHGQFRYMLYGSNEQAFDSPQSSLRSA